MNLRDLVVIPALNEEQSVGQVVRRTCDIGLTCLVVDDGSRDETATVARESGARVISMPYNVGIGGALRAGFRWAVAHEFNRVVQCDADGQHSPDLILELLNHQKTTGAHLVIGSRFLSNDEYDAGVVRGWLMRRMSSVASSVAGTRLTDTTSGFRCISNPLLEQFARSYPQEYMDSFEALIVAAKCGYKISETATPMSHRLAGTASNRALRAAGFTVRVLAGGVLGTHFSIERFVDSSDRSPSRL